MTPVDMQFHRDLLRVRHTRIRGTSQRHRRARGEKCRGFKLIQAALRLREMDPAVGHIRPCNFRVPRKP